MNKIASADMVIFGGGIAGLWLLNRLRQTGLSAILFETGSLGGGQTHKSQGIIHGGMKYALQGLLTNEARAMAGMPAIWSRCLKGEGEIDLSGVPILSPQQYLWSPNKFTSALTGLFANTALTSPVTAVQKEAYPSIFQHPAFTGDLYSLDEMVIDVPTLVRELAKSNQDAIFKINPFQASDFVFNDQGHLVSAKLNLMGKIVELQAQHFIFAAGAGNEMITQQLKQANVAMQRRPLHMVLVKTAFEAPLYAHCLGLGTKPRMTITTHRMQDGSPIWYLGGQIAEEGVTRDSASQIKAAKKELQHLFPWMDFSLAEFATFTIDRAEPMQASGAKPDCAFVKTINNVSIAWPTKLALAPQLAETILTQLHATPLHPKPLDIRELRSLPIPPFAKPIWEEAFCVPA